MSFGAGTADDSLPSAQRLVRPRPPKNNFPCALYSKANAQHIHQGPSKPCTKLKGNSYTRQRQAARLPTALGPCTGNTPHRTDTNTHMRSNRWAGNFFDGDVHLQPTVVLQYVQTGGLIYAYGMWSAKALVCVQQHCLVAEKNWEGTRQTTMN